MKSIITISIIGLLNITFALMFFVPIYFRTHLPTDKATFEGATPESEEAYAHVVGIAGGFAEYNFATGVILLTISAILGVKRSKS
jgi:hypothetical protein